MVPTRIPWKWAPLTRLCAAALIALAAGAGGRAGPEPGGDELRLAIILSRHGVRTPLIGPEALEAIGGKAWPKWEAAPAIQTPHGNQLMALMGDYYRARLLRDGALSGAPSADADRVFIRTDNDQRTIETGRILGKALSQVGDPEVHALAEGVTDPLFRPYEAHVGNADTSLAAASILGRMGGDPRNLDRAYARQFEELKGILFGPGAAPGADSVFSAPSSVSPGHGRSLVDFTGPFQGALETTDALLLEYVDSKPMADVGWGRMDEKGLLDVLSLHEAFFDMAERTRYPAQVGASNLASHIVDTLEQAATGDSVPGALGPTGERVVVLVGHDTNLACLGGLFDMNWCIDGSQMNPTLPGSALVIELWRHGGKDGPFFVRTTYVSQTLDQMRESAPLSLEHPPALAPIFVPGCSGAGPGYDAPLAAFVRQARRVIDPAFIAPEQ